jgi:hypothetical protein
MLSIDKSGDLKINKRKCRLYKKDEVIKVAKKLGIDTVKKTTPEICASMKSLVVKKPNRNNIPLAKLYPQDKKPNRNNIPLAKLYPQVKKPKATMVDKKVAVNFMKGMVTTNNNIAKLKKLNVPSKKAAPLSINQAEKRIMAMKTLSIPVRKSLVSRMKVNKSMSPRRHVKIARARAQLA